MLVKDHIQDLHFRFNDVYWSNDHIATYKACTCEQGKYQVDHYGAVKYVFIKFKFSFLGRVFNLSATLAPLFKKARAAAPRLQKNLCDLWASVRQGHLSEPITLGTLLSIPYLIQSIILYELYYQNDLAI